MANKINITVVNDHQEFLDLLVDFLTEEGYEVIAFPKHQDAFVQIKASKPDIVICDLMFDNMPSGWALIDMLYLDPATHGIPIILCSAATKQVQEVVPSFAAKGIRWLEKPFELDTLLGLLDEVKEGEMNRVRPKPRKAN